MSGKGGETSPVRVSRVSSRLKKRRRPIKDCALQSLPAPLKQSRHSGKSHCAHGNFDCKENIWNGLPSVSGRDSALAGKGEGLGAVALQRADPPLKTAGGPTEREKPLKGHAKSDGVEINKSTLEFMDDMEQTALMSAIPSMLGINMMRYQSTADFEKELERAFECRGNHTINDEAKQTHFHHSILGRIDFSNAICSEEHSIAFPPCGSSCFEAAKKEDPSGTILLQHLNLTRKTGHGMCIPPSFYQFPFPETQSPGVGLVNYDEGERTVQAKEPPSPECISGSRDDRKVFDNNRVDQQAEKPSSPERMSLEYQGKIKIISQRGATIREVWDIDKSKHVIGKLHEGDERYFMEKKNLDPPPIAVDDSDTESDDECVAVFRYKIALTPADCGESAQLAMDNAGPLVGWISDRGRLADDAYAILREVC